jgi:AcrR family transcriptional regulator
MGRPPSAAADRAILEATLRLLGDQGYARLTVEGVAAAAGVAKTTIYRRYSDKLELVTAAIGMVRGLDEPPESGDARADMIELVRRFQALMAGPGRTMLATLLAEERRSPELLARFRAALIEPSREQGRALLRRAQERGAVRADADPEAIMDMLAGSYFTRHLAGVPSTATTPDELVGELWRGIGAPATPPARPAPSRRRSTGPPRR